MNNDLISRSELANIIGNWFAVIDYRPEMVDPYNAALLEAGNEVVAAAVEAINNAPAVNAAPVWISVEERLPETEEWVAVWYCDKDGDCFPTVGQYRYNAFRDKKHWFTDADLNDSAYPPEKITHWMPLPAAPKMDGDPDV